MVQGGSGFVQKEDLAVQEQCGDKGRPLFLPAREGLYTGVEKVIGKRESFEKLWQPRKVFLQVSVGLEGKGLFEPLP